MAAIIACGIAIPLLSARAQNEQDQPLSVAVLDFKEANRNLSGVGASVSALLQVQLTVHSTAMLVERAELNEVLAEQELTLSDAVTPGQAAMVAQLTGAEVLVSGRIFEIQDRVHLVAKVISASTSRVFGATASYDKGKPLDAAVEKLAQDVSKLLTHKAKDLRGGASIEELKLAEMKKLMDGKTAGTVYVSIAEQVIRTVVPDPAAQTEVLRSFDAAGWTAVDDPSKADLVIRGEAFAESAIRRGNLWFFRARLEFTVTDKAGKTLKTDRVVCGNVDLAEAVGAKGALQKAGLLAAPIALRAWVEAK